MDPVTPMPLFSLPNEILQRILELLKDDSVESLSIFRLCSMKSNEASNRLFFQTVSLRTVQDLKNRPWRDRLNDWDYLDDVHDDHIPKIFDQLLDPCSDAALHVRHLCIGPWPEHRREHPRMTQLRTDLMVSKYARILDACDGLRDFTWKMETSIPPSVLHILHTKHPQCRLHISWKGVIHPMTNLEYIASPQLTTLEICADEYGYPLFMDQISGLVSKVNRLESLSIKHGKNGYGINLITADHESSLPSDRNDLPLLNVQHLELGPWFQDSPEDVRSCMRAINWTVLRSLKLTCKFPSRLLSALRGQIPNLEHLDIMLDFKSRRAGHRGMPDSDPLGITHFVDFLSEAPLLIDLTLWVNNWDTWNFFWDKLPIWRGETFRKLDLAWPSGYPHARQRYWMADDLQKLVTKAPNIETLALELELDWEEDADQGLICRTLLEWPGPAQEVLLQLTCLRELRLAVPLYGMNTVITSACWENTVDLRQDAVEGILKVLYDAFEHPNRSCHLELLEVVFWGRSWRMKTRNWRYTLRKASRSSLMHPRYRIDKSSTGKLDLEPQHRVFDPWHGGWNGDRGYEY